MKMNNVYFLTFDDTYHKFEILKCGNEIGRASLGKECPT